MKLQLLGVGVLIAAGAWFYSKSLDESDRPVPGPGSIPALGTAPTPPADAAGPTVSIAGEDWPVTGYEGIGLPSKPLDLRACFTFDGAVPEGPAAPRALPPEGPGWFDCFDGAAIAADIAAGRASAILAAPEEMPGADRVIAVYPNGRAFQWRQPSVE